MWDHGAGADETPGMVDSSNPDGAVRAALALDRAGRVPEAIAAYEAILARWPALADLWYNLAVLRRRQRELEPALAAYAEALARGIARPEEVHLNRAEIYSDYLRQDAAAERELNAALAANPRFIPALLNLGNLNEDLGRREEASRLYERILALDPKCHEALARLANARDARTPAPELIARLERALAAPGTAAAERASLGFALGRLKDGAGDYRAAFAAYAEANRASRASMAPGTPSYDPKRQEAWIDRLIAAPTPTRPPGPRDRAGPVPVFVCGMHRSGSTLIEQLLAAQPGVAAGGELDLLPRFAALELAPYPASLAAVTPATLEVLATRYLDEIARLFPGARYVTDKRPDNFLAIGLIKSLFPEARIVHTVRDPLDTCLSIYFLHLDHGMGYALDLMDIGHYFREYRRLMRHWKMRFGADIYDLDYDRLVAAPEETVGALCRFLGIEPGAGGHDRAEGRAVKTASVWQVREPIYRRSSGRAANYAAELGALRAYLAAPPA